MSPSSRSRTGRSTVALPEDELLVARLQDGDDAAFALVLDAWSSGMLRLARGFVSTDASAAEVVQDAWLAMIEGIGRFEGRSSLKTWVYRILVNIARRRREQEGRSLPWSSLAARDAGPTVDESRFQGPDEPFPRHWRLPPAPWPSPEQEVLGGEVRAQVAAAVEDLPEHQRIVITLRDVVGYSSEEVSAMLDITAGNQRVLLHRARAYVRGRLESYFGSDRHAGGEGAVAR
jgi:RNA polymerase sigma-70 factor, ECF subfamily